MKGITVFIINNNNWKPIALNIDAKLLSNKEVGGFVDKIASIVYF